MKYTRYISLSLLIFSSIFLLCTVFATDPSLENGLVMGKVYWFHLSMLIMSVCTLVAALWMKPAKQFIFLPVDGLVLFLAVIVVLTYDWQLNPEPEKLLVGGQLIMLWFLLRFIFNEWQPLRLCFLVVIMGTGLVEVISGICQLHGFENSNHSLFKLTGDFYNPGPYSGYLALVLPLCVWMILEFDKYKKVGWRQAKIYLYYMAWVCLLGILIVLPAGMSRTAWIAAIVSCMWVYWGKRIGWKKTKRIMKKYQILSLVSSILIVASLAGAFIGIYTLKMDSANGRLLLWKVTARAIMEQPWSGTGLGGFPAAYTETQAAYFASGKATEIEMTVAGCPDYGFNEFLQIGLEQGIAGLVVFVLLLGHSLLRGIKNGQLGAAGGILSLMVFSLASYPLQLPEFWVILVVFTAVVNTPLDRATSFCLFRGGQKRIIFITIIGIFVVCCGGIFWQQKKYYEGYKKWNRVKIMHNNEVYEAASNGYEELVLLMKHRPELLFETALCLNRTKRYAEANKLLCRAMRLSSDPMIYYIAAKNEQALGNYREAEKLLLHAINILPERIYPYYLLAKLYSEEAFFQEDKFFNIAEVVLEKEPRVASLAIQEMKSEIQKMLNDKYKNHN